MSNTEAPVLPRLFISAVTAEYYTIRQEVAKVVRHLGYQPVSMDDWSAGNGELRSWLRLQIDSCDGMIHLLGYAYGAEPKNHDPAAHGLPANTPRYSYTQYEFLYAQARGIKTWVIQPGDGCTRDKEICKLDLPTEDGHSDPQAYQQERSQLQMEWIDRLKNENYLRHKPNDDKDLRLMLHTLTDHAAQLRSNFRDWQNCLSTNLTSVEGKVDDIQGSSTALRRDTSNLLRISGTAAVFLLLLSAITWFKFRAIEIRTDVSTSKITAALNDPIVLKAKLRSQIRLATERRIAELKSSNAKWEDVAAVEEQGDQQERLVDSLVDSIGKTLGGDADQVYIEAVRVLENEGFQEAIRYLQHKAPSIFEEAKAIGKEVKDAQLRLETKLQPMILLARFHESQLHYSESLAVLEQIVNTAPSSWNANFEIGRIQTDLANWENAEARLQRALALAQSDEQLATTKNQLGIYYHFKNSDAKALPLFREVLAYDLKSHGSSDPKTLTTYQNLASTLLGLNEASEAEQIFRRNLAAHVTHKDLMGIANACHGLASSLRDQRKFDEAEKFARQALDGFTRNGKPDRSGAASAHNALGLILEQTDRLDDAESEFKKAYEIDREFLNAEHPRIGIDLSNVARVLLQMNKVDEAESYFRRALDINTSSFGPLQRTSIEARNALAQLLQRTKNYSDAEKLFRMALEESEKAFGLSATMTANQCNNLAELLREAASQRGGSFMEADSLYRRAIQIAVANSGENGADVLLPTQNLALSLVQQEKLDEAEIYAQKAIKIYRSMESGIRLGEAYTLTTLGSIYQKRNSHEKAAEWHRQASLIMAKSLRATGYKDVHFADVIAPYFISQVNAGLAPADAKAALLKIGEDTGWDQGEWDKELQSMVQEMSGNRNKDASEDAMTAYRSGNYNEAKKRWERELADLNNDPSSSQADIFLRRMNVAACDIGLKKFLKARDSLKKLVNEMNQSKQSISGVAQARARHHLARAMLGLGDREAAATLLHEAIAIYSKLPAADLPKELLSESQEFLADIELQR